MKTDTLSLKKFENYTINLTIVSSASKNLKKSIGVSVNCSTREIEFEVMHNYTQKTYDSLQGAIKAYNNAT